MDKVKFERQYLLVYKDVFDDAVDVVELVRHLPLEAAVQFIAHVLHLFNVRKRDDTEFQSRSLFSWILKMKNAAQWQVLQFVMENNELILAPSFKFIDRRPCLNLIQYLLVHADAQSVRNLDSEDYSVMLKLLLWFNAEELHHQVDAFEWDGTGTTEKYADLIMFAHIRDIENRNFKNYAIQVIKIHYFFEFCSTHSDYGTLLDKFLTALNLPSYEHYLWHLISPILKMMTTVPPSPSMELRDKPVFDFFRRLSINGYAAIDNDYKQIRSYPLFAFENSHFIFLDFRFFVDKLYNGFLFDFAAITGLPFSKLKQQLGDGFSEHVLFYTTIAGCFANYGNVRKSGAELKQKLLSGEPDYYLRKGQNVCLFEFKDILLPATVKYAKKIEDIKNGIAERLERDISGKRKGITQLLNSVSMLLEGIYQKSGIDDITNDVIIYPIIVHTDVSLECAGVNYFLNDRMQHHIKELKLPENKIAPLVIIHIETLIQLQEYFCDGHLDLIDCLEAYHKYTSSTDPVTDTFPFDEFVKYHLVQTVGLRLNHQPRLFQEIIGKFARSK
ncbi:hypothetical protein [Chitinophaga varians]|uniref:hypothetical protein n=1 Tax=Chitinophaga varians TaxID=2202339 RepID=UPI00165F9D7D|nr:hypothetical protein [Chitinophaga varians]MBC9909840.1 hypothetical protein [Chitinophaga varians]